MRIFYIQVILLFISLLSFNSVLISQVKINESFEGSEFPPQGWSLYNSISEQGQWSRSGRTAKVGSGCAVSNFSNSAASNYLITRRFTPTPGDSLVIYFRQTFWNVYKDTFNIRISNTDSLPANFSTILLHLQDGTTYPSPLNYTRFAVSLNSYSGQSVWIAFQHFNVDGDNLRIDEIKVGNAVAAEVGVADNIFPEGLWGMCSFTDYKPSAVIKNYSTTSVTTPFNITYKITGPVSYTSIKSDTLFSGYSKTIYFDNMSNITVPGVYNVKIFTSLTDDGNRSNDTLTSAFTLNPTNYGGGTASNGNYFFANSTECSNIALSHPEFCWRDTTSSVNLISNGTVALPTLLTGNADNGYFSLGNILPDGKKIKFFNSEYDSVFITTNGIIGFTKNNILTANDPAQVYSLMIQPVPALAQFWIDLDFQNTNVPQNRLSYRVVHNQLIITYDRAPLKSGNADDYISFQVSFEIGNSLMANSNIVIQFNQNSTGSSFLSRYYGNSLPAHLIGMKNISGTNTLTYRYRDNSSLTTAGPMFNSSLAIQIGSAQDKLNSKCSEMDLKVLLEAINPRTDTITVSISEAGNPGEIIESKKMFLASDGSGTGKFTLPDNTGRYYLLINHRNSLMTWSRLGGEVFTDYFLNYDFSTDSTQAFGSNMKMKNSKAYIYSGDVNKDGVIDVSDLSNVDNSAYQLLGGYLSTDINGDGITDIADISFVENNNGMNIHVINP
jgi:hypothetical protein